MPLDSLMPGDQCAPGGFFLNRTRSIFSALSSPCVTRDQAAMGQRCMLLALILLSVFGGPLSFRPQFAFQVFSRVMFFKLDSDCL